MDRIGIIGLFTALEKLCENQNYDDVKAVIQAVLEEARNVNKNEK